MKLTCPHGRWYLIPRLICRRPRPFSGEFRGCCSLMVLEVPSDLGVCPVTGTLSFLVFYVFSLHKFYLLMGERCKHFKELLAIPAFRQCLILSWHIYSICVCVSDSYLPLQKFDHHTVYKVLYPLFELITIL